MKTYVKLAAISALAAAIVLPASAQNSGADIYKAKCQMCHGVDGTANTPAGHAIKATSFKSPAVIQTPDADLIAIVKAARERCQPSPASSPTTRSRQSSPIFGHYRSHKLKQSTCSDDHAHDGNSDRLSFRSSPATRRCPCVARALFASALRECSIVRAMERSVGVAISS